MTGLSGHDDVHFLSVFTKNEHPQSCCSTGSPGVTQIDNAGPTSSEIPIIGLSGYARTGKDTLAQALADYGYHRVAFADKIREALLLLNPSVTGSGIARVMPVAAVVGALGWERAKDEVPEVRQLLQRLGSDMAHPIFGKDCWVRIGLAAVDGLTVFTDCRFPLECDAIKAAGGQVWRIERPGYAPVNAHPSETALDDYDFDRHIFNIGSVDDLRAAASDLLVGA